MPRQVRACVPVSYCLQAHDRDSITTPCRVDVLFSKSDMTCILLTDRSGSIIVSKSGGRYRIQADSVPVLYVLASELLKRLTIRLREISSEGKSGPPKFSLVTFSGEC